jgi:hypothetical protein
MPFNIINMANKLLEKIENFYKTNIAFKAPLKQIIKKMLENCKYVNEESLERHNFGEHPVRLKDIPKDDKSEKKLLKALEINNEDKIDSSIIELLWGDIQLGKRVHACIIMWVSVYILERPVMYIFRNLKIDQKQLQDDIMGTDEYNFNIQYIKNIFSDFVGKNENINENHWKRFKLPELKDIGTSGVLEKLSDKDSINPNDIFCCLMNHIQLDKINKKINEYICYNKELLNITLIVDESDLYSPTGSNDNEKNKINKDLSDSTKCEQLLSKIYKKVKYVLHVTGTSHSLLYNTTTTLSEDTSIQIPISKVHKMKRSDNYYGFFNDKINFNTTEITDWWNDKTKTYTIEEDYKINIKKIIQQILNKSQNIYHSFLISEEKIREKHLLLAHTILTDFTDLFIIMFNGTNLKLYLPKKHESKIKYWSQKDSDSCKTGKRLFDSGGIYGSSFNKSESSKLPNNYCYFTIDTKKFNIKQIYKILAMFFKEELDIKFRTVITITGKYGERGYSFTSDDYNKYQFHLTDQYFPCHVKNKNCTDISQRLRLQGKYDKTSELTLWTSTELKDIIENFYIPFIKVIESDIMSCENWSDIKNLVEDIIGDGFIKFVKYFKYIDVQKKRKNIDMKKRYEIENDGFKLITIENKTKHEIKKWCEEHNLPKYKCINEIYNISANKIENQSFKHLNRKEVAIKFNIPFDKKILKKECDLLKISEPLESWHKSRKEHDYKCLMGKVWKEYSLEEIKTNKYNGINADDNGGERLINIYYDDNYNKKYCIRHTTNKYILNKVIIKHKNPMFTAKTPFCKDEKTQNIKQSRLKEKYKNNFKLNAYYWKTPDGWLYLHDKSKNKDSIISIKITSSEDVVEKKNIIYNNDIQLFIKTYIKKSDKYNFRTGISDIIEHYEDWCKNTKNTPKNKNILKLEMENFGYKEENSKGIDKYNKSGKRGYNLDLIKLA